MIDWTARNEETSKKPHFATGRQRLYRYERQRRRRKELLGGIKKPAVAAAAAALAAVAAAAASVRCCSGVCSTAVV
jgi:hypothetical protein